MTMLCLSISASAYDFEVDGIRYDITSFTELTVSASSLSDDIGSNLVVPESVVFNGKTLHVTNVSEGFAENNPILTTLVISAKVDCISANAFKNCSQLKTVEISQSKSIGNSTFENCEKLTSVILPENLLNVGSRVFAGCIALESIYLPSFLKVLGEGFFLNCTKLNNINISNVVVINPSAFSGCKSLSNIILSNNLDVIGSNAFEETAFETVVIPNSVSSIGTNVFNNCNCLKSVTIGSGITSLPQCFSGCNRLSYIRFEDGNSSIKMAPGSEIYEKKAYSRTQTVYKGFFSDTNITKVYLGRNFENYTSSPSNWQDSFSNPFIGASNLKEVELGPFVEELPAIKDYWFNAYGTFEGCTGLQKIKLGHNLKSISSYCFKNCISLDSISIPHKVKQIPAFSFYNCTKLSFVSFGYYCDEISESAFRGIEKLQTINFYGINPPKYLGGFSNEEYISTKIFVPENSQKKYAETIPWANFWNITEDKNLLAYFTIDGIQYERLENNDVKLIGTEITEISDIILSEIVVYNNQDFFLTGISDTAFTGNKFLRTIVIPNGIVEIKDNQFSDCINLNEIVLPDNLRVIGRNAFRNCNTLKKINIPNSVQSIGGYCFYGCKSLETIDLKGCGIIAVPDNIFENCEQLSTISLPSSVETIGNRAFYNCKSLLSIDLDKIQSIGNEAFSHCESIKSINIPKSCMLVGNGAFDGLNSLKTLIIEQDPSAIILGHSNKLTLSSTITPFPNPSDVDERRTGFRNGYYDGLFSGLPVEHLVINRDIELPKYYERTMGNSTSSYSTVYNDIVYYPPFYGLTNLKYLEIGENVSAICKNKIEAVVNAIPATMEYTNFGKCDNIEVVVSNNPNAPIGGGFSQSVYENASLFLPNGGIDSYKTDDYWKNFAHLNETSFIPIESIAFESDEVTIDINDSKELHPIINPSDASIINLKWNSSKPSIVSVSEDGIITTSSLDGEAIITATTCDGTNLSASIKIIVQEGAGISDIVADRNIDISIKKDGSILISGKSETDIVEIFNIQGQLITSSASNIITLNSDGVYLVKIGSVCKKIVL